MNQASPNVAPMPTDWWAFYEYRFQPLGICEDFDEAAEKADEKYVGNTWIVDRPELNRMFDDMTNEISSTATISTSGGPFWWAFHDGKFNPIGIHRDFEVASDEADKEYRNNLWTLDRDSLIEFRDAISKELNHGLPPGFGTF